MDHIFNLKCLVDLFLHRNKHLFCAFIDYRKAFDSVNRLAWWQKLLQQNVNGKMLKIIYSMYNTIVQNHVFGKTNICQIIFLAMLESVRVRTYPKYSFHCF